MLDIKILIRKLPAINTDAPGTIAVEKVTSLNHEAVDDTVERAAFVAHWPTLGVLMLARAELTKVFGGAGDAVGVEFEFHAPGWHAAYRDVEEDDWIGVCELFHALDRGFARHLGRREL